jgi:hypothetical protein
VFGHFKWYMHPPLICLISPSRTAAQVQKLLIPPRYWYTRSTDRRQLNRTRAAADGVRQRSCHQPAAARTAWTLRWPRAPVPSVPLVATYSRPHLTILFFLPRFVTAHGWSQRRIYTKIYIGQNKIIKHLDKTIKYM